MLVIGVPMLPVLLLLWSTARKWLWHPVFLVKIWTPCSHQICWAVPSTSSLLRHDQYHHLLSSLAFCLERFLFDGQFPGPTLLPRLFLECCVYSMPLRNCAAWHKGQKDYVTPQLKSLQSVERQGSAPYCTNQTCGPSLKRNSTIESTWVTKIILWMPD